jgi:dTDP-4-dehydrorhamnose 3,5-epimerase
MKCLNRVLGDAMVLEPTVYGDERGYFLEFYNARTFAGLGIDCPFVQDDHSHSGRGVLRGMHYQLHQPQATLVRVVGGEIFDVIVDVRRGSPTFGKWHGERLSAANKRMVFLPAGFAHGFYVLSETADIVYKCSDFYAPGDERGVLWSDPDLGIAWPLAGATPTVSAKDRALPPLAQMPDDALPVWTPAGAR